MGFVVPVPATVTPILANTAAAGLSFASCFFLFLVNLGAPIINAINIATYELKIGKTVSSKMVFGPYGFCQDGTKLTAQSSALDCRSYSESYLYNFSTGGTKFLLAMHAIGVITSFMLFAIGIYSRNNAALVYKYKRATWAAGIFNSFIVFLAMVGQIDFYLTLKRLLNIFSLETITSKGGVTLGAGGFILVFMAFIVSLLSTLAFYVGEQQAAIGETNGSSYNEYEGNMSTGMANQPLQSYSTTQTPQHYSNNQSHPPQPYSNNQPHPPQHYPNNQPHPPQHYPNNQPHPPQHYSKPQPHSNNKLYSPQRYSE